MMIFVLIAILLSAIAGIAAIITMERKKSTKAKQGYNTKRKGIISLSTYYRLNRFYDDFFLTRGGFRKVKTRLSELSVYTSQEIQITAVRFYTISTLSSAGLILAGILIFGDLFSVLLVVLYAVVMRNILVDKQIDGVHFKLLKQLSLAVSSVRQNYLRLNSIPDSIAEAETGSEVQRAFEEIYLILTASDGEKRLEEFYASTPFRQLQTFAGVSYVLNNSGDTKLRDGSSNFIQSMGMMADEINLEIRKIALQKARFGFLEYLPVAPLAAIGVIENFFAGIIPGTTVLYNGTLGYISRTVIILASIIGYATIVKINSPASIRSDDRSALIMWLLSKKWFGKLTTDMTPKKERAVMSKHKIIRGALSMTNLRHMYASKMVYALVAFVMATSCLFLSVYLGKEYIYDNIKEVSLIGGEELTAEDIGIRKKMDEIYLSIPQLPSEKQTTEFVKQYLPKLPAFDQDAQVKRLQEKYESYYNSYFKWWMLLVAFGFGLIGWNTPEIVLRVRAWMVKSESEEDVLQLQTIIAILMNTSTDTLDTLYWLERQSRVHKNAIRYAYHEYPSNPELALGRLKNTSRLAGFKRLVDKLILTIHQITLAEAFSDLVTERDHVMRIREISQNTALNRKRALVSPLSMAPLVLTAILYILVPIGILGFREFVDALSNVQQ